MLNVEYVNQFASFGAILAGFSMSIAYSFFLHKEESNKPNQNLLHYTGGAFLASAVLLILGVFLASLVLSVHSANGVQNAPTPSVLKGADWVFYITLFGALSMLIGVALSGFSRTKRLGFFTATMALLAAIGSYYIYSILI